MFLSSAMEHVLIPTCHVQTVVLTCELERAERVSQNGAGTVSAGYPRHEEKGPKFNASLRSFVM